MVHMVIYIDIDRWIVMNKYRLQCGQYGYRVISQLFSDLDPTGKRWDFFSKHGY